jgi:CRISPR-associated endonuclease/helicase Cas3
MVEEMFGKGVGRFLAYCIAGHHGGLPDWSSAEGTGQAALQFQERQVKDLGDVAAFIADNIAAVMVPFRNWKDVFSSLANSWMKLRKIPM